MLQDAQSVRYYQKLTDALVDLWHRGYSTDYLRLYVDGYLACLRYSNPIEAYLVNRIEDEVFRFLYDTSNFEMYMPQTETERDYY